MLNLNTQSLKQHATDGVAQDRNMRMVASFVAVVAILVCFCRIQLFSNGLLWASSRDNGAWAYAIESVSSLILNTAVPTVLGPHLETVAIALTTFENHPTAIEAESHLILKHFVIQFVSRYFIPLYLAFKRHDLGQVRLIVMVLLLGRLVSGVLSVYHRQRACKRSCVQHSLNLDFPRL